MPVTDKDRARAEGCAVGAWRKESPPNEPQRSVCPICQDALTDKYLWCRPCIARAARGAAAYFIKGDRRYEQFDGDDLKDCLRRQSNRWQHRFKRRLRARSRRAQR